MNLKDEDSLKSEEVSDEEAAEITPVAKIRFNSQLEFPESKQYLPPPVLK